jgi:uncharacterized protein YtpQ (UPF0354 family)
MRTVLVVGLALLAAGVGAGCAAGRSTQRQEASGKDLVATELEAFLRAELPGHAVAWADADSLSVTKPGESGGALLAVDNVRQKVAAAQEGGEDAAARRAVYASYLAVLRDMEAEPATATADAARLLPRLVSQGYLAGIAESGGDPISTRPLAGTHLHVAYVLDSPSHVRFVNAKHLESLGLTREALEQRALENLRQMPVKLVPLSTQQPREGTLAEAVSLVVEGGEGVLLLSQDTFDAARLLLLPSLLSGTQGLAALAPERDGLVLLPLPPGDAQWAQVRQMGQGLYEQSKQRGQPLSAVPLRVTAAGVAQVD